jgi:hypothetical protein
MERFEYQRIEHRGLWLSTFPEFEPVSQRIERGDYRSLIVGSGLTVRYQGRLLAKCRGFSSETEALTWAKNKIDAIVDSL